MNILSFIKRNICKLLTVALVLACVLSMSSGTVNISVPDMLNCFFQENGASYNVNKTILIEVRLPRTIGAALVGMGLALAGVSTQTLFRNPLASPYIIGISGGAAMGASCSILLCCGKNFSSFLFPSCIIGGVSAAFANFILSSRKPSLSRSLLLNGIAINSFCSAFVSLALFLSNEKMQTLVFWLMGGLWKVSLTDLYILFPSMLVFYLVIYYNSKSMNLILLGERHASDMGVNVRCFQIMLLIAVSVAVSLIVSVSGLIGFICLIVPHLLRLYLGADHRKLVPAVALAGGILLIVADVLARMLVGPTEIPVGIITASVGAPVFMWLLNSRSEV